MARAHAEATEPFDLERGPLLRICLYELPKGDSVLQVVMHHIISDAWSMAVLVDEVVRLYRAYAAGETSPLSALPIQYADYAAWQRKWLTGDELERQLAYWREALQDAELVLDLPTDRPRPALKTYRGAAFDFDVPKALRRRIEALCRSEDLTLYMTMPRRLPSAASAL